MKNKKGFTVVELLVAFVIMSLIAGIGIIVYNSFLEKSEIDYYHTIESNLLLSGNSYFQDNRSKLPVNNYTSVLVSDLIDQNYIEPIKDKDGNLCREGNVFIYHEDGKYNYEACIKCGDYESSGRYCSYGTGEKSIAYPTTALCKFKSNLTYTGSEITLTKVLETEAYTLTNNKGTTAGEYTVTASLKSSQGYYWNDSIHSTTDKTFKCSIYPAIPNITIPTKIEVVKGGTETLAESSSVKGQFVNNIEDSDLGNLNIETATVNANEVKTLVVTGLEQGNTKILIDFTPSDTQNYQPVSKVVDLIVKNKERACGWKVSTTSNVTSCSETAQSTIDGITSNPVEGNKYTTCTSKGKTTQIYYEITYHHCNKTSQGYCTGSSDRTTKEVCDRINSGNAPSWGSDCECSWTGSSPTTCSQRSYEVTSYDKNDYSYVCGKIINEPKAKDYCNNLNYNGTMQVLTKTPSEGFEFSNNIQINAGTYEVVASLKDGYVWDDETFGNKTIRCTIEKLKIDIPQSPANKVYTGLTQSHGVIIPNNTSIVSGSDESGIDAKDYTLKIKINDTNNSEWSDGTSGEKTVNWRIDKTPTTTSLSSVEKTYNGSNQEASGTISKLSSTDQAVVGGTYSYKYYTDSSCTTGETSTSPKTAGQYYVIATLVGTNNYSGSSSGCTSYKMKKYTPTITISSTEGSVALDKNVSFNEKADVKGTFTNTIVSTTIGTVSPVNTSSINANTNTNVTVTGKAVGTTTVIITFTPDDTTNYASINSTSSEKKVYNLSVIEIQCNGVKEYWSGSECLNCGTNEVANSSHTGCICASGYNEMFNGNCGSCPSNSTYNSSTKTCVCNTGYYGSNCSTYCGGAYDHWTGSRCVSCSASQTWNGTSCVDPTPTCGGNKHWNGSACVCNTGYYGSNCNTYCGGTYDHWTGSTCVSCSSSQTWNGTSCVDPTPTCGGNKHWNGSACVCNTGYYGSNCSTYCGGTYDHWTGSACVSCSASQTWNGTRCANKTCDGGSFNQKGAVCSYGQMSGTCPSRGESGTTVTCNMGCAVCGEGACYVGNQRLTGVNGETCCATGILSFNC